VTASIALALLLSGGLGCGEPQGPPLEVTYYYLPG
jgi:hypothetical protein